jgi:DNA-binding MarR family transcriptional regulator
MNIQASNWAWSLKGLTSDEKLVLLALAFHCEPNSVCCSVSKSQLVEDTFIAESTLKKVINKLKNKDLLFVDQQYGEDGSSLPNLYIFNCFKVQE